MNGVALKEYYNRRARVYEKIYEKPERQEDLSAISLELQNILSRHNILEVACGTGLNASPKQQHLFWALTKALKCLKSHKRRTSPMRGSYKKMRTLSRKSPEILRRGLRVFGGLTSQKRR